MIIYNGDTKRVTLPHADSGTGRLPTTNTRGPGEEAMASSLNPR